LTAMRAANLDLDEGLLAELEEHGDGNRSQTL
jgi:hypothetical protein